MIHKEIGQYQILEKIGHGGMGLVYKGIHKKIEKIVAIKALSPQLSEDPKMKERFINEAKLQAKLSHPNIVNIINYIEHEDNIYLIMEYVDGETLENKLKREGALPYEEAVEISVDILEALNYLHSKGIVHRDLKPSNIIFSESGIVKITDFGISKLIGNKGVTTTALAGSYIYMSPEEIKGEGTTYLSDIYSFGIMLYQMITGNVPYYYDSQYKLMKAHLEEKPIHPIKIKNNIPSKLSESVIKAISKNPQIRFKTPEELKMELKESILNRSFFELAYKKLSERKSVALSLAVLLIFFILSITLFNKTDITTASVKTNNVVSKNEDLKHYEFVNLDFLEDDKITKSNSDLGKKDLEKQKEYKKITKKKIAKKKAIKPVRKTVVKPVQKKKTVVAANPKTKTVVKTEEVKPEPVKEEIKQEPVIKREWKIRK